MAHEIEDNLAFYGSNLPAWHGLGTVLKDAPSIDEAWKLAYPFELFSLPLTAHIDAEDGTHEYKDIESHKAIFRSDAKHIAVVGDGYELVQPYKAFDFFRPWIESGEVELEAGGSLCEGKRMWALAKIKGAAHEVAANDKIQGYFLVYTSFDGSLSHGIKFTPTRVVCQNTLTQSINGGGETIRLRHTKSIHAKLDAVQASVDIARQNFAKICEDYSILAERKVTREAQRTYIKRVMLGDEDANKDAKELSTKLMNKLNSVEWLLENQRGLEKVPVIRGTAWQAYNAVTDYLTHEHGHNQDSRLNSAWFGQSATLNRRALELAHAM
jgi:phage/plasmid-like protein (TIGR03299 family)